MIHEHALRKIEFYLHQYCLDQNVQPILDNLLEAANRGYSSGSYLVRGNFVLAPLENAENRMNSGEMEILWPFTSESQARRFLVLVRDYFYVRGTRADVLGVEGFTFNH
jgi:hypothetical protein